MRLSKNLMIPVGVISLALVAGAAAISPLAAQQTKAETKAYSCPNMLGARNLLLQARIRLQDASHDFDGHRTGGVRPC